MSDEEDPGELNRSPRERSSAPPMELQMSFKARNNSSSPTRLSHKKPAAKSVAARLRGRKSTPAPPTKGDGRKRFINSPVPEDKQVRKRIDFGSNEEDSEDELDGNQDSDQGLADEDTEEHGEYLPLSNECRVMVIAPARMESATLSDGNCIIPEAVPATATNIPISGETPLPETSTRGEILVVHEVNDAFAGIEVKLPEMANETNLTFESALEPPHLEGSRVATDLGAQDQPKMDYLLPVVSLDSAEMLDSAAAQPLLRHDHSLILSHSLTPTPPFGQRGSDWSIQPGGGSYVPPPPFLEHFPPLERGQTRKICDTFEKRHVIRLGCITTVADTARNRAGYCGTG